ncbi:MAG: ABC transporter ATP-binding protein [Chloroflexota bacterium]
MAIHNAESTLLTVADLRYTYGGSPAIDGISFTQQTHQLTALVGRNGSGKSTLLRCLAGWTRAKEGTILLLEKPLAEYRHASRHLVTLVPDTPPFYDDLSAWEHIQFVAQAHRLEGWQPYATELLERFGLHSWRNAFPLSFSRGMRYKLALCLALLVKPKLLLLDEPFGPLDPLSADHLWDELSRMRDGGMGILLSSHQLPPQAIPDYYLVLELGRITALGTPDDLRTKLGLGATVSLEDLLRTTVGAVEPHDGA